VDAISFEVSNTPHIPAPVAPHVALHGHSRPACSVQQWYEHVQYPGLSCWYPRKGGHAAYLTCQPTWLTSTPQQELLGHCLALYHANRSTIQLLENHLGQYGFHAPPGMTREPEEPLAATALNPFTAAAKGTAGRVGYKRKRGAARAQATPPTVPSCFRQGRGLYQQAHNTPYPLLLPVLAAGDLMDLDDAPDDLDLLQAEGMLRLGAAAGGTDRMPSSVATGAGAAKTVRMHGVHATPAAGTGTRSAAMRKATPASKLAAQSLVSAQPRTYLRTNGAHEGISVAPRRYPYPPRSRPSLPTPHSSHGKLRLYAVRSFVLPTH
jgi:hypothetical protein